MFRFIRAWLRRRAYRQARAKAREARAYIMWPSVNVLRDQLAMLSMRVYELEKKK